jgi:O-acetylhomoserine (thiol)-lyase
MNSEKTQQGLGTLALHAGQVPDPTTGSRTVPLYQTASYVFRDIEHAANLFALKEPGNIYTRLMNPTTDVFEKRMAAIEGGTMALATATGQAAISFALLAISQVGDHFVALDNLYGGTYQLFHNTFPKLARKVTFVPSDAPADVIRKAIRPETKGLYAEMIGNPKLNVADLDMLSAVAHEAGIPLIVDNTVGVGLVKPFEHGADIIVSSATKYIGGHGTSLGGVIIENGIFPYNNGKFPEFTTPDPGYHGLVYWDALGSSCLCTKIRISLMRDMGFTLSPFNAREFLLGLETLHLRQARHCENALAVARFLSSHPQVAWVNYPGLETASTHALAKKYLKNGFCGIVGFGIKGGLEAGIKFVNSLKLFSHLANIGDAKSLVIHPASTTHQQLTEAEQKATGVTPDFIRLSIGLEDIKDIVGDLHQALG